MDGNTGEYFTIHILTCYYNGSLHWWIWGEVVLALDCMLEVSTFASIHFFRSHAQEFVVITIAPTIKHQLSISKIIISPCQMYVYGFSSSSSSWSISQQCGFHHAAVTCSCGAPGHRHHRPPVVTGHRAVLLLLDDVATVCKKKHFIIFFQTSELKGQNKDKYMILQTMFIIDIFLSLLDNYWSWHWHCAIYMWCETRYQALNNCLFSSSILILDIWPSL